MSVRYVSGDEMESPNPSGVHPAFSLKQQPFAMLAEAGERRESEKRIKSSASRLSD